MLKEAVRPYKCNYLINQSSLKCRTCALHMLPITCERFADCFINRLPIGRLQCDLASTQQCMGFRIQHAEILEHSTTHVVVLNCEFK